MENGGEGLEDDALLRILKTVAFSLIFVLSVKGLNGNIIFEGVVQVFHTLDIELDV